MPEFLGTAQGDREAAIAGVPPATGTSILGAPPPTLQPIKKEEKPKEVCFRGCMCVCVRVCMLLGGWVGGAGGGGGVVGEGK